VPYVLWDNEGHCWACGRNGSYDGVYRLCEQCDTPENRDRYFRLAAELEEIRLTWLEDARRRRNGSS
jgi:DNA topoisomerase IB